MISSYLNMLTSNFPLTLPKALVFFWIFKHGISLGKQLKKKNHIARSPNRNRSIPTSRDLDTTSRDLETTSCDLQHVKATAWTLNSCLTIILKKNTNKR